MSFATGSLVKARGREWVVLPEFEDNLLILRPLGGTDEEIAGIYLPLESVEPATSTLPEPSQLGDHRSCRLLRDAVRLGFRASAGPFRSFAHLGIEPRPYQLVPLLMALKLDPVRLVIADDVGIGKTVEACLIARELLDRSEVQRIAVLCPPQLAEQWQSELRDKFHIDAALVLPGAVTRLEKHCRVGESLFDIYPFVVVSIDFIKSDRRRGDFLRACPELVIVDEAHTCSYSGEGRSGRHQRHQLISGPAASEKARHLILVTATPHSGNEQSFRSLLGLLDQSFSPARGSPAAGGAPHRHATHGLVRGPSFGDDQTEYRAFKGSAEPSEVRRATILVRNPAMALAFLNQSQAREWVRVIGPEARPVPTNVVNIGNFQKNATDLPWSNVISGLTGSGTLQTGPDRWIVTNNFPTSSGQEWIAGRAAIAVEFVSTILSAEIESRLTAFLESVEDGTAVRAVSRTNGLVRPSGTRSEPRLWVRRLAVWEKPGSVIRDIKLRRGLNIIWSRDPGVESAIIGRGDGSGHDAGCRYDHILDWRHARADTRSPVLGMSREQIVVGVRSLLGVLDREEISLKDERDSLAEQRRSLERDLIYYQRRIDQLRTALSSVLGTQDNAASGGELELGAWRAQAENRLAREDDGVNVDGWRAELAAVRIERDGVLGDAAVIDGDLRRLGGTLALNEAQVSILRGERANLDAAEIKAKLGEVCPVCRGCAT